MRIGNTLTLGARTVNETRAQFTHSNLLALPTDPVGPAVSIAGVASFGTFPSSPAGAAATGCCRSPTPLSQQRGGHALRAGVDFIYNDDSIRFPRAERGSYAFASLATFLAGTYNNAGFSQTFGEMEVAQGNANAGVYAQDEWRVTTGLTVNLGLRYDLQFLDSVGTDRDNVSPRAGFAWTPSESRNLVVRGSAGLFFDRVPLRAVANALLSANNTTDLGNLQQLNLGLSPAQAGAPQFPAILTAPVPTGHARQPDHDAARPPERLLAPGQPRSGASGGTVGCRQRGLFVSSGAGPADGHQPERALVRRAGHQQRLPAQLRSTPTTASIRRRASPFTTGCSSRSRSVRRSGATTGVSYTLSKSENNVGEFFFSGPIDPYDLSKDWGRSDNDRRHLFVVSGGVNTSMAPATTVWETVSHGFQLSTLLQAYSAAPFNITSGVTTIQGTAGRPVVDGEYIPRNSGVGDEFFSLGLRVSRSFRLGGERASRPWPRCST